MIEQARDILVWDGRWTGGASHLRGLQHDRGLAGAVLVQKTRRGFRRCALTSPSAPSARQALRDLRQAAGPAEADALPREEAVLPRVLALRDVALDVRKGRRSHHRPQWLRQIDAATADSPDAVGHDRRVSITAACRAARARRGLQSRVTGAEKPVHQRRDIGISRAEMERRFDAVAGSPTSGLHRQPIKTYSGDDHRLAFAYPSTSIRTS